MDYKKLAADLLSRCEENCANCEYAGDSEFECTIAKLASTAITELLVENQAMRNAANGFKERAEKAEKERDKAIERIRRDRWCEDCSEYPVISCCDNECDCDFCGSPCYCKNCHEGSLWEWKGWENK